MLCEVNVIIFRQFLVLNCLSKLIIRLLSIQAYNMVKSRCFLISLLFRIVFSLNHIHLPQFMIHKVNVIFFRKFVCFYCLSKLILWLKYDVLSISLFFRIVSSLNHIHLHLFLFHKVNAILFRQFLGFYCLSKLTVWLNYDCFFISWYLVSFLAWITFRYLSHVV